MQIFTKIIVTEATKKSKPAKSKSPTEIIAYSLSDCENDSSNDSITSNDPDWSRTPLYKKTSGTSRLRTVVF